MPRATFKTSAFAGAVPGLSRLAASLAGGGQAYQQGFDTANMNQSRMAQALAQIDQSRAAADKYGAEAESKRAETQLLQRRPDQLEEQAALASGTDLPLVRLIRQSIATGQAPQVEMAGPTEDGSPLMGDINPAKASAVRQALQRFMPIAMNSGDFKIDDWAKAQGAYRDMDLGDQVLGGQRQAGDVGRAQAAVAAKPLYNSDATGAVLDLFGGGLNESGGLAQGAIQLRKDQAGAQRANAAQSYAAADNSRASAAETRAGMGGGGGGKAPVGYRWGAAGALEPIPGGPADPNTKGAKLAKPPTEGQAKALMFGSRMAVADEVLSELERKGQLLPSLSKQAAESVPLVGTGLGMVANQFASEGQQQVEQAQRDFINAVLRRESGAAIANTEFANAQRQYFPAPGDSPGVLRQKAANRRTAIAGMQAEFGEPSMPQYRQIVEQARAARKAPAKNSGGATGSWDDPASGGQWNIERVE